MGPAAYFAAVLEEQVASRLAAWSPALVTVERIRLLADLSAIYEREGVLVDGRAPALHACCPDKAACWANDRHRISADSHVEGGRPAGEDGSIYWPWIGADYRAGGVCLIGWNLVHHGEWWAPLIEEFVISGNQRTSLVGGKRSAARSRFWWGSMASAAALVASLRGAPLVARPEPHDVAPVLDEVARVQAVKCSPLGRRSNPSREMTRRCPKRFLLRELEILEPAAMLCLGSAARGALGEGIDIQWREWEDNFQRGTCVLDGGRADVLVVPHPGGAWARWPAGQDKLVASLSAEPLRTQRPRMAAAPPERDAPIEGQP